MILCTTRSCAGKQGRSSIWEMLQSACARVRKFRGDQSGTVVVIFAFILVTLVGTGGGAVDYGRWQQARNETVNAMDAAVLAAGRVMQLPGSTEADAIAAAQKYYNENKPGILAPDNVSFSITTQGTVMIGNSSGSLVKTPFLNLFGIPHLQVNASSKAILAANSNSGSDVEIAMMLDTTGSMSGQKMVDLQAAAKDLIEIVVWPDQSVYTSRVALAPFSRYVNVGTANFNSVTGVTASGDPDQRTCVKERQGADRYTDASPTAGGFFDYYTGSGTCAPTSAVVPLTADKNLLKAQIDNFPTTGRTAGHLGTAWAWYLISPNWSGIWTGSTTPKPYSLISQTNGAGQPKLYKIAILMTDGVYNQEYSGADSTTQARAICDNMKAEGVTVYTVGFEISVGSTPDLTMQHCASSSTHYYNASNGEALKLAFRDIALKISTLRLAE